MTVKPIMRTNSGDSCLAAARQHKGNILQPSFIVASDLQNVASVELLPSYPSRQFVSPKVRAMIDFLSQAFEKTTW